jgi:hypothetical protein
LGGVARRLARLLLASIQLPRALSDPDDLPIGGFSDIATRGASRIRDPILGSDS